MPCLQWLWIAVVVWLNYTTLGFDGLELGWGNLGTHAGGVHRDKGRGFLGAAVYLDAGLLGCFALGTTGLAGSPGDKRLQAVVLIP